MAELVDGGVVEFVGDRAFEGVRRRGSFCDAVLGRDETGELPLEEVLDRLMEPRVPCVDGLRHCEAAVDGGHQVLDRSQPLDEPCELLGERPIDECRVLLQKGVEVVVGDRCQQFVLIAEVPVERVRGDTGVCGDPTHGCGVVAVDDEELCRRGNQLVAALLFGDGAAVARHARILTAVQDAGNLLNMSQELRDSATGSLPPRREVWFMSDEARCHAWLYLPEPGSAPAPVIVMGHGLGAIKTLRLGAFAQRFQAAGYGCLVFDYRHFGDSEGEPRELLSIRRQRQDWRAAVAYARSLVEVDTDRVVLWGTSFGGGHAIVTAADDSAVVAAIAQCPFTDGLASARQISPRGSARLAVAAVRDQLARLLGRPPIRVKVAARPGQVGLMDAQDVIDGVLGLLEASGLTEEEYRNDVPARVAFEIPLDAPGRRVGEVRCPILFCVADGDSVAPAKATLRHAAKAPRGEIRRYDAGHFDIYIEDHFERLIRDQLAFLRTHVPTVTA